MSKTPFDVDVSSPGAAGGLHNNLSVPNQQHQSQTSNSNSSSSSSQQNSSSQQQQQQQQAPGFCSGNTATTAQRQAQSGQSRTFRVGEYDLGKELGTGSSCVVRQCRHIPSGVIYAAKIIPRGNPEEEENLKREVRALSKIENEHVIQYRQLLLSAHNYYVIMEAALGGDLLDKILSHQNGMPTPLVRRLFTQLVRGLTAAHMAKIAHRDLKPENILLDAKGNIKLSDFGVARFHKGRHKANPDEYSNTFVGTIEYAAPEVFSGEGYDGFRADLWSLGCVLHAMLSGKFPFGFHPTKQELLEAISSGKYVPLPPSTDALAVNLVSRLIVVEPKSRLTCIDVLNHEFLLSAPGTPSSREVMATSATSNVSSASSPTSAASGSGSGSGSSSLPNNNQPQQQQQQQQRSNNNQQQLGNSPHSNQSTPGGGNRAGANEMNTTPNHHTPKSQHATVIAPSPEGHQILKSFHAAGGSFGGNNSTSSALGSSLHSVGSNHSNSGLGGSGNGNGGTHRSGGGSGSSGENSASNSPNSLQVIPPMLASCTSGSTAGNSPSQNYAQPHSHSQQHQHQQHFDNFEFSRHSQQLPRSPVPAQQQQQQLQSHSNSSHPSSSSSSSSGMLGHAPSCFEESVQSLSNLNQYPSSTTSNNGGNSFPRSSSSLGSQPQYQQQQAQPQMQHQQVQQYGSSGQSGNGFQNFSTGSLPSGGNSLNQFTSSTGSVGGGGSIGDNSLGSGGRGGGGGASLGQRGGIAAAQAAAHAALQQQQAHY